MQSDLPHDGGDAATHNAWSISDAPPKLAAQKDIPRYDLATLVHVLGVRRTTVLAWQQQLGIPTTGQLTEQGDQARRYSERDLAMLIWIRDRVLSGMQPAEAIAWLHSAQETDGPASLPFSGPLVLNQPYQPRINTQPLRHNTFGAPPPAGPTNERTLQDRRADPSRSAALPRPRPDVLATMPSGPLTYQDVPETARIQRVAGPVGTTLQELAPRLIRAFGALDTASANAVLGEALTIASVESVCVGLLQPVLNRVGDLWAHRQITMPEERFALTYLRGFLYAHFHSAAERPTGPMVFIGCGPREDHDLGALMLAAFWRHAGLRVIYLGQNVEATSLVQEAHSRHPALVALVVTNPQQVRALARISRSLQQLPAPRPLFAFGGPVFARNPELQRKVSGVYLGDDVTTATWHIRKLLGLDSRRATVGR